MNFDTPSTTAGPSRGQWALTSEAFHKLLSFLDPDMEQAGQRYEEIRRKLVRLFQWRGSAFPEELVDETMNRVARKIDQGEQVLTPDPYRYFCGVARLVFHETLRKRQRERTALEQEPWPPAIVPEETEDEDKLRLDCLRAGVATLPSASQRLILVYYEGDKGKKIKNRRGLAQELGIPLNALRIRAHRIRIKLEASVSKCMEEVV